MGEKKERTIEFDGLKIRIEKSDSIDVSFLLHKLQRFGYLQSQLVPMSDGAHRVYFPTGKNIPLSVYDSVKL